MDRHHVGLLTSLSLSFFALFCLDFSNRPAQEHHSGGDSKEVPAHVPSMQQLQKQESLQAALKMHRNLLHGWLCEGSMDCFKCACSSWKDIDQLLSSPSMSPLAAATGWGSSGCSCAAAF